MKYINNITTLPQKNIDSNTCLSESSITESVLSIRRAVGSVYLKGLPDYDPISCYLNGSNIEDIAMVRQE